MTNEEKQILIKDLSARLPYGVIIQYPNIFMPSEIIKSRLEEISYTLIGIDEYKININDCGISIEYVKPYLRPMSSMTAEEQQEFILFHCVKLCPIIITDMLTLVNESKMFNWLNAHHFDYRGLISMGLGIEAPEGMYN